MKSAYGIWSISKQTVGVPCQMTSVAVGSAGGFEDAIEAHWAETVVIRKHGTVKLAPLSCDWPFWCLCQPPDLRIGAEFHLTQQNKAKSRPAPQGFFTHGGPSFEWSVAPECHGSGRCHRCVNAADSGMVSWFGSGLRHAV